MNSRTLYMVGFVASVLAFTQGCMIVPIPTPEHNFSEWSPAENPQDFYSRKNLSKSSTNSIIAGRTTKAEVILHLGEPDLVSEDGRRMVYRWTKVRGYMVIMVPGGGATPAIPKNYYLVIDFNEQDLAVNREIKSAGWFREYSAENLLTSAAEPRTDLRQYQTVRLALTDAAGSSHSPECLAAFKSQLMSKLESLGFLLVETNHQMVLELAIKSLNLDGRYGKAELKYVAWFKKTAGQSLAEVHGRELYKPLLGFFKDHDAALTRLITQAVNKIGQFIQNHAEPQEGGKPSVIGSGAEKDFPVPPRARSKTTRSDGASEPSGR